MKIEKRFYQRSRKANSRKIKVKKKDIKESYTNKDKYQKIAEVTERNSSYKKEILDEKHKEKINSDVSIQELKSKN